MQYLVMFLTTYNIDDNIDNIDDDNYVDDIDDVDKIQHH